MENEMLKFLTILTNLSIENSLIGHLAENSQIGYLAENSQIGYLPESISTADRLVET